MRVCALHTLAYCIIPGNNLCKRDMSDINSDGVFFFVSLIHTLTVHKYRAHVYVLNGVAYAAVANYFCVALSLKSQKKKNKLA